MRDDAVLRHALPLGRGLGRLEDWELGPMRSKPSRPSWKNCSLWLCNVHCWNAAQYTETVLLIFPFLQTNITAQMRPSGGWGRGIKLNSMTFQDAWKPWLFHIFQQCWWRFELHECVLSLVSSVFINSYFPLQSQSNLSFTWNKNSSNANTPSIMVGVMLSC